AALLILGIGVGAIFYFLRRIPEKHESQLARITAPIVPEHPHAQVPASKFAEITSSAGISFVHNNGAYGDKLLPESMGGGVAFFDFDNDGASDLLFINSTWWPGHIPEGKQPTTMALYQNNGKGHFTDVTARSGLDLRC